MTERRVLIVEDSPANLLLVEAVLQRAGFRTAAAGSAEEATAHPRASRPDLVLTDVQLPGRDGLELTRQIRADPALADLVVVALTAAVMPGDRERVQAAECDGYITKPISVRTLAQELLTILDARPPSSP